MSTPEAGPSKELRKLIKHRVSIKSTIQVINEYVKNFNPAIHSSRQLQIRLTKLNECIDLFNEAQQSIADLDQGHDEERERLKFEDECLTLKATMEDLIAKNTPTEIVNTSHSSHSSTGDSLRLPTIQPPTFNGNLEDWPSFFDTFNALFHNNATLNDVQRLHYLKTSVCGPAADIIKTFTITAENYQVAYNELVRQFENRSLTIQTHIRALLQSPKVTSPSAADLRKLHHHIASHVRALKALGQPVQYWDAWLVTLICSQLDSITAGEWQLRQDNKELPTYEQIELFLSKRVSAYEVCSNSVNISDKISKAKPPYHYHDNNKSLFTRSSDQKTIKCPLCSSAHRIYHCDTFDKLPLSEKRTVVRNAKLCFNCLNYGHQSADCKFSHCPKCNKKHNSKLHEEPSSERPSISQTNDELTSHPIATAMCTGVANTHPSNLNVLLATAIVNVCDNFGTMHSCRAVMDSGSQLNFITESFAKKLKLSEIMKSLNIIGVSSMSSSSKQLEDTTVCSRFGDYTTKITLHSLPIIVNSLPSHLVIRENLKIPNNLQNLLADPQFHVPGPIDLLLGADLFFEIFSGTKVALNKHAALHHTKFGWIVTGKVLETSNSNKSSALMVNHDSALSFFISKSNQRAMEELRAEEHFKENFCRSTNGRFIVRLPLSQNPDVLGNSLTMAEKRFFNLERRLARDSSLAKQYDEFIQEYIALGHMELTTPASDKPMYYLPHHAVFKSDSSTTKLRVVFDGSAESTSGLSLNDIMLRGPKIQPDIYNILLRFRLHHIALTADVAKMYRQVLVDEGDCYLQRIVYRSHPDESLKHFNLKTVTYGTKSASFLATRCLFQLGYEHRDTAIGQTICNDFYVDDLISGGDSDQDCFSIYEQLQSILGSAGFPLRKWCSSSKDLLNRLPHAQDDPNFMVKLSEDDVVSALGLLWQPSIDSFRFLMKKWTPPQFITKRSLLSNINSVYDPIGFISCVLIKGKIFMQQVWSFKMDWDEPLPGELYSKWIKFYSSLGNLDKLIIPRLALAHCSTRYTLHGFCDASQNAFGACVYIRSETSDNVFVVNLYTSRSRVAPIKATTIPRLELCGALLLAELITEVKDELKKSNITVTSNNIYLWTDSTIVLAWINSLSLFQVYVANRIARINDLTHASQWHHTPTSENPADLISRGVDVDSISTCYIWWHGPKWLSKDKQIWPRNPTLPSELPEIRPINMVLSAIAEENFWILNKYSSWIMLIRITALVRRFVSNCKHSLSKHPERRVFDSITLNELLLAERFWLIKAQGSAFHDELVCLKAKKNVHRKSALTSLSPFIDDEGLIRVGGRLTNAHMHYSSKHPIVLPSRATITKLIFRYEHCRLMHVGPQALLAHISIKYWAIRGRIVARKVVQQCVQCFRANPRFSAPPMAPLPKERVTIERAFNRTGVDFCGPVLIRSGIRRVTAIKCYIAVFVCFVTRAMHLELVTDLTADAFIAALSRFMSRRGMCSHLYSDNATNFVGAHKVLKQYFSQSSKNQRVTDLMANQGIQWHFIPPSAPHFGGLWEAAVKSAKRLMLKITKGALLTAEELNTLLCKIEAVLNSRPMTSLSDDPSEYKALTPSHFIIGGNLMLPQEPDLSAVPMNRLRRFQLMQAQLQRFWTRWSMEYLPQMQRRGRWTSPSRAIQVGDLAILKEDNVPILQWKLVRISAVHPGADGIIRVVTIKQSAGAEMKRPVVKLALLPSTVDIADSEDPISS